VHRATGPNQVWSWDITYLQTAVRGQCLYLYLVLDVWSRRIVGWCVHEREAASHAANMMRHICDDAGINAEGLILHSDNGKPMRGSTRVATLRWLGIIPSFSRPHVSDDNPYSEALFRTLKYAPAYPIHAFGDLDGARCWVTRFVGWYNGEHRHSAIRFVTPDQRHSGREKTVLAKRALLYAAAKRIKPERWTGETRNWLPIVSVVLPFSVFMIGRYLRIMVMRHKSPQNMMRMTRGKEQDGDAKQDWVLAQRFHRAEAIL